MQSLQNIGSMWWDRDYLLLVTYETDDNYSIQFEISNNSSTIRFDSKWKKHYSHSTSEDVDKAT